MSETTWRLIVGALAVALVVVGGILIASLVGGDDPSPTPSAAPTTSPSLPAASPTLSPSPSLSPSPTASPSPTDSPTEPPTPTAPPTAEPTLAPTEAPTLAPGGPVREIRILGLGLDAEDAEGATQRLLTFQVDGPAQVSVGISNLSAGRARTCLWLGDALNVAEEECRNLRNGRSLERTVADPGRTTWTVSLIGRGAQISPSTDVQLRFNSTAAALTFDQFRFQGSEAENYNGIVAEMPVLTGGEMVIDAQIDDGEGGQYPYRLVIERLGPDGGIVHQSGGEPADRAAATQSVSAGRSYRLSLGNTQEFAEQQVLLRGTLTWP